MESSELLRRIRDELQGRIVKPGEGWKTSRQWAVEWGLQQSQTNRLLSRAVEAGIMERSQFRVACENRGCYPVPHYREITSPK